MGRHIINAAIISFVLTTFCLSFGLITAFAEEGGFQSIPSNITPCVGDCQKEVYPYAVLSKDAYEKTHENSVLPNWYYVCSDGWGWGYGASLYINTVEKKIVYAFRGTQWYDLKDWTDNLLQFVGIIPESYYDSITYMFYYIGLMKDNSDYFKDYEFIVAGHSLGGGLAQFIAKTFKLKAYTFNTAPIHDNVDDPEKVYLVSSPIMDYYNGIGGIGNTEILNIVSKNSQFNYFDIVSWTPGNLYGTTESIEIDDAIGPVSTHGIGTIVTQLEQNLFSTSSPQCGAYVAPGVWKEFDCYNLAAIGKTTNDDPFTPTWRLIGGYWQWGRKGPDPSQWYNTNTEHFAHGPTGPGDSEANDAAISGWDSTDAPDGAWSDSYKTANDPCPAGYRVPTKAQWEGVVDNNTQSTVGTWSSGYYDNTNYSAARFFGNDLMLPAAGIRYYSSGSLYYRGLLGYYWSSTQGTSGDAWNLGFSSCNAGTNNGNYRRFGFSVRCVAE